MAFRGYVFLVGLALLLPPSMPNAAFGQHRGDVWIGRTGDGTLAISPTDASFIPEQNYVVLGPSGGVFPGWSDDDPGFDSMTISTNGVFPMDPGADVWLEVVDMEPAFRLVTDSLEVLNEPGESARFPGGHRVHEHWTWNIQSTHPEFDPEQCVWRATFFLRDEGTTGYESSRNFTFQFTNVPLRTADGDFDEDGLVDQTDYAAFATCLFGPDATPLPDDPDVTTCEVECLNAFDFDADDDVDVADFARLQERFDG
jgi:hypothetical protein